MANPVMNNIDQLAARTTPAGYPTMPGYAPGSHGYPAGSGMNSATAPYAQAPTTGGPAQTRPDDATAEELNSAYYSPSADAVDRGRVTFDDILMRTGMLLAMVFAGAAVNWVATLNNPQLGMGLTVVGLFAGLALVFVNVFKKTISPLLISAYAVAEGLALGGISVLFEAAYPGIVKNAVLATFAVAGVTLLAYKMRWVRYTAKMNKILIIGLFSLLGYRLLLMLLTWTGLMPAAANFEQITVMGLPIGGLIGLLAIGLATVALIGDFDTAERAVAAGLPKQVAWMVGFGMTVTLVWLYTEILRILAIFSGRD